MKHVDRVLGWDEASWLYDRDFYVFFSFYQSVLKDRKCERAFDASMTN